MASKAEKTEKKAADVVMQTDRTVLEPTVYKSGWLHAALTAEGCFSVSAE